MISFAFGALVALQPPADASTPEPGDVRIFGDWAVGCDNGWVCEAISLGTEDWAVGTEASLTVRRAGGPDGYHRIGIRFMEENIPDRLVLHIDGERVAVAERAGGGELHEFAPDIAQNLGYRLSRGQRAELLDPNGGSVGEVSLTGSYAAMLYIEDRQQRAGTVTASVSVGDEAASTVAEPPSLPITQAMPIAARYGETVEPLPMEEAETLHEARECDGFGVRRTRNDAFVLSDAADLILISCSDGAYNFSDIAFIRRAGVVTAARFDQAFSWGDRREIPLLVNSYWDAEANTLSTYAKGRGIGDCGTAERFVWDGDMFRLIERREMNTCRGSRHWITVYRANIENVSP